MERSQAHRIWKGRINAPFRMDWSLSFPGTCHSQKWRPFFSESTTYREVVAKSVFYKLIITNTGELSKVCEFSKRLTEIWKNNSCSLSNAGLA